MKLHDVLVARISRRPARIARWVALLSPLWMVFGSILLGGIGLGPRLTFLNGFVSFLVMLAAAVTFLAYGGGTELGLLRSGTPGDLSIATGGILVRIGDYELRDRVISGVREQLGELHQVLLELQSGDALCVATRDADEADAILDAAGVGPRQRAVGLRIGRVQSPIFRGLLATLYVGGLIVGLTAALGLLATVGEGFRRHSHSLVFLEAFAVLTFIAWATVWAAGRALAVRTVRIGQDGVLFQSGRFEKTFLPFESLRSQRVGARVGFRAGARTTRVAASTPEEAVRLVEHIERAKAEHDRREQLGTTLLSRNGRRLEDWRSDLTALVAEQGYRAPMTSRELADVAEDPRAPREQRLGAVLALAALPPEAPERARIRVAIDTTADPKLRLALERAVEGELEEADLAESSRLRR